MVDDLDLECSIEGPAGWIVLEDEANGYSLESSSFGEASTTHRKTEVSSEWIEGSFVVRSVRENVTETLAVYVTGATPYELATRLAALTNALEQNSFILTTRWGNLAETYYCSVADYKVTASQPLRFATMALVTATVPHLPTVGRSMV